MNYIHKGLTMRLALAIVIASAATSVSAAEPILYDYRQVPALWLPAQLPR